MKTEKNSGADWVRVNFRLNARLKVTGSMLGSMLEIRVNVRNFQGQSSKIRVKVRILNFDPKL